MVETANNVNLSVNEDDFEELLEVIPEELTNEKLLKLEQKNIAEEEAGEKETAVEEKEEPSENSQKSISKRFCKPRQAL